MLVAHAVIHEGEPLHQVELPRCVQLEPVGPRRASRRMSPAVIRVAGLRHGADTFLSFDAFCKVLDQFPGLEELHLQGAGEPLSHPRFFDMVHRAAARGIEVAATSRLQAFSRRRAEECVASGLRRLNVPLDAAGTREYDFSRRGPRHERLLRHLRYLVEAKKARGSRWPWLAFTAVVMRRNLDGLADVVRLAHAHGADGVAVLRLEDFADASGIASGRHRMLKFIEGESLSGVDEALIQRRFDDARALARELGIGLQLPAARRTPAGEGACPWPLHGTFITHSGDARPCGMAARRASPSMGNVLKEGVVNVWRGEAYDGFRAAHHSPAPPEPCASCPRR